MNCLILIFTHFPIHLGILKFLLSLCAIRWFAKSEHDLLVLQLPSDRSLLPAALPARLAALLLRVVVLSARFNVSFPGSRSHSVVLPCS